MLKPLLAIAILLATAFGAHAETITLKQGGPPICRPNPTPGGVLDCIWLNYLNQPVAGQHSFTIQENFVRSATNQRINVFGKCWRLSGVNVSQGTATYTSCS